MNFRHDGAVAGAATFEPPDDSPSPLVLVIDDTREIREWMSLFLRKCGYRVIEAVDGLAAQTLLLTERPALVVCDLEMPLSDGWDVLAFCHLKFPDLPVIIVSGSALGRRPEIERWAASFIAKPFGVARFRDEVERLLSRPASRRPN